MVIDDIEIEVKYRIAHGKRGRLVVDTYYQVPGRAALRLRSSEGRARLTAKGPATDVGALAQARPEIEIDVDPRVAEILALVQIPVKVVLRKHRTEERDGGATVVFDHVEGLGDFVEIEGPEPEIARIAAARGFPSEAIEKRSYLELALDLR